MSKDPSPFTVADQHVAGQKTEFRKTQSVVYKSRPCAALPQNIEIHIVCALNY